MFRTVIFPNDLKEWYLIILGIDPKAVVILWSVFPGLTSIPYHFLAVQGINKKHVLIFKDFRDLGKM